MRQKNLLCDVFDAWFYDSNDNLVFMSQNLTQSDITGNADSTEVRNGRGNGLFSVLNSNKSVEVKLTTNAFDFSTLALLCGSEVATGEGTCYTAPYEAKIEKGLLPIPSIPLDKNVAPLNIYLGEQKLSTEKMEVSEEDKCIFLGTREYDGKTLYVHPFEYELEGTNDKITEITIRADKFPKAGKLVLRGVEKSQETEDMYDLIIVLEKAKPSSSFSISTTSEVKPTDTEITLNALVNNGKLMKMYELPIDFAEYDVEAFDPSKVILRHGLKPITDLSAVDDGGTSANLSWTIPEKDTVSTITLMYKKSSEESWNEVDTTGSLTAVSIPAPLTKDSTSVKVTNLASESYDFKLNVLGGESAGDSNIATRTI